MPDEPLFTVRELADQLGLPESTVRYYRDAFLDHIPAVGTGRRRRYPPAALAVLRSIADGYAAGLTRGAILRRLGGDGAPSGGRPRAGPETYAAGLEEEISNLDLLAAIVDGEREQREALWQMAREVVRLTQVLEEQEAALAALGPGGAPALPAGRARALPAGSVPAEPPAATAGAAPVAGPRPWSPGPESAAAAGGPPRAGARGPDLSELARLREELEAERQLVDRLREARVRLEQRAVAAEGEARRRRGWRASFLGRLFGGNGAAP